MIRNQLKFDTTSISYAILCKNCEEEFTTDSIQIPTYQINEDELKEYSEIHNCPNCKKEFEIIVYLSAAEICASINADEDEFVTINDSVSYRIAEAEEYYGYQIKAILEGENHFSIFNLGVFYICDLYELKKHADQELKRIILMNCYIGLVTQLETYLMNTLVTNVLNEKKYFKTFIVEFKDFKNHKFSISEIFKEQDELEKKVKKTLSDLIYHNLKKIKPIYEAVFKIQIPEIGELIKIISVRHDIVHRGGKCKNGNFIKIDEETFNDAKLKINVFVETIEKQIASLQPIDSTKPKETVNPKPPPDSYEEIFDPNLAF